VTYYQHETVTTNRILQIGGEAGVVVYVDGEERQYRGIHCRWDKDMTQWIITTAVYGTRTQKKTWTVRDAWHHENATWANMGPFPAEVRSAGMQAILDSVKRDLNLGEVMRASIEGDGPPTIKYTEVPA
jgi:hypothetical protein